MSDQIQPRTKSERLAYIEGYANAIVEIDRNGIEEARKWLRQMADLDVMDQSPPEMP